jgi:Zn-dependent peptidase ImmA (M78 family)
MEVAPVGLQRVEDYGARERRELQANIFAREFLLPRAFARRLHVDDGMGATAIANRTGLSKTPYCFRHRHRIIRTKRPRTPSHPTHRKKKRLHIEASHFNFKQAPELAKPVLS